MKYYIINDGAYILRVTGSIVHWRHRNYSGDDTSWKESGLLAQEVINHTRAKEITYDELVLELI